MASSFNKVIVMGNLTKDPELRQAGAGGNMVAVFGVAVNETFKLKDGTKRETVMFIDCEAWNMLGKLCAQYLKKGRRVLIEGKLKADTWERDGQKHVRHKIVVENMKFCDSQPVGGVQAAASTSPVVQQPVQYQQPAVQQPVAPVQQPAASQPTIQSQQAMAQQPSAPWSDYDDIPF